MGVSLLTKGSGHPPDVWCLKLIVPPLCVGRHPVTLRVTSPGLNARHLRDAERPGRCYHAERGNDQTDIWCY